MAGPSTASSPRPGAAPGEAGTPGDREPELGAGGSRATIYEVAHRAGVSVSTVSRAFRAPSLLREETRGRVHEAARVLGYVPNRAAGGLTTGRTSNLALVVPDMANPVFPLLVKAAQGRARVADYAVFLVDTDEESAVEAHAIRAMAKQVDGVIVCAPRMADEHLHELAQVTPLVLVNRRAGDIPAVTIDMAGGMREAVMHLYALGHRECVYVAGPRASWSSRQRRKAFRDAARRLAMASSVLGPFEPRYEAGLQAADRLLAAGATAVVAYNDLLALGIRARLGQRGVVVPDEMSVVGFDDIAMASMASPPLTSVAMPAAEAGRAAVELMLQVLGQSPGDERGRYALRTELRVRASTGPCRSAGDGNGRRRAGVGQARQGAP